MELVADFCIPWFRNSIALQRNNGAAFNSYAFAAQ
jgi:hypothetical protein